MCFITTLGADDMQFRFSIFFPLHRSRFCFCKPQFDGILFTAIHFFITYVARGGRGESIGRGREGNGCSSRKLHLDSVLGRRIVVVERGGFVIHDDVLAEGDPEVESKTDPNGAWKDPHSTWECH